MDPIRKKRTFWSLAGPLLGYWGIQMGVQFLIQTVIEIPYLARVYTDMISSGKTYTFEEMFEAVMPALETVVRHRVEIAGAAALFTMILTALLFRSDRKRERLFAAEGAPEETVKAPVSKYWTIAVMGLIGCIGVTCLSAMAQAALYDSEYRQTAESMYASPFAVQLLVLGLIVPLAEELMFRGVMYRRYRENQSFLYSALWSSLFFSFMHTNGTQMVYTFLLGMLLCYLYEKFGSFKAPVVLHASLNLGSVIFTRMGVFSWLSGGPERLAAAVIASAFVCSAMFVLIQRMEGKSVMPPKENR